MPTPFTHAFAGVALGGIVPPPVPAKRIWFLAAFSAALPDVDVLGFALHIPYGSMFGHRGFTHSLFFAAVWALVVVWKAFPELPKFGSAWWRLLAFFFVVTASHGFFDALTDGGKGIAFFAPFSATRYFFPWRPIRVSPIGPRFFSARGLHIMENELLWVWTPMAAAWLAAWAFRRFRDRKLVERA